MKIALCWGKQERDRASDSFWQDAPSQPAELGRRIPYTDVRLKSDGYLIELDFGSVTLTVFTYFITSFFR